MRLPVNLSLPMVADAMAALGVPIDERNVGRALQGVVIPGVAAPEAPGGRWHIPRSRLTDVAAACLYRRQRRSHDRWAADLERCRWRAAELMMDHDELWRFIPRPMAKAIIEQREERARIRMEAARRREAERKRQEREAKRWRLAWERRTREAHEKAVWDWCYSVCLSAARDAVGAKGPQDDRPEVRQVYRDFPVPRPDWWMPPPDLLPPMREYLKDLANIPAEYPDWKQWIPEYRPNEPWPWRRSEPDDGDAASS